MTEVTPVSLRPSTRDRSFTLPDAPAVKQRPFPTSISDNNIAATASDTPLETINADNTVQRMEQTNLNNMRTINLNKSLSIVGKLQESLREEKTAFDTEGVKKKWYHFHLKAAGERKLVNG